MVLSALLSIIWDNLESGMISTLGSSGMSTVITTELLRVREALEEELVSELLVSDMLADSDGDTNSLGDGGPSDTTGVGIGCLSVTVSGAFVRAESLSEGPGVVPESFSSFGSGEATV